jgi:hypothetical protein
MATEHNTMASVTRSQLPGREKLKSDAADVMETAKQVGEQKFETGKKSAAEQAQKLAGVMEQASTQLKENDLQSLADYTSQIASSIKSVSDSLRHRNIDDLVKDTQSLARRNPTLFLLGSIGIGVAISRFLRASAERQHESYGGSAATPPVDSSELPRDPEPVTFEPSPDL